MRAFQCGLASLWGVSPIHLGQSVTPFINSRAIFYLSITYLICYNDLWSLFWRRLQPRFFRYDCIKLIAKMQFSEKRSEIPILGLDSRLRQAYNPPPLSRNGERNWPGSLRCNGPQYKNY